MRNIALATVMLCIAMCLYAPWTAQRAPAGVNPSTRAGDPNPPDAAVWSAMDGQAIEGTPVYVNRPAWAARSWTDASFSYTGELDSLLLYEVIVALLTAGVATLGGVVAYQRWADGYLDPYDVWRQQ